jgi:anaerobic magnesium-protoporphyrin IX monomethyl ester cyclase
MSLKILLVNPPRYHGIPVIREERCEITERYSVLPPYSLLQLASLLRVANHDVELIDGNGWNLSWEELNGRLRDEEYNALIFRFTPTTFDWDLQTASISKKKDQTAYTIGICWTLQSAAKEVLRSHPDLDIYVMHEYESVVPQLILAISKGDDLEGVAGIAYRINNEVKVNRAAKPISDWNSLPIPAYDLLPTFRTYFINTPHGSPFTIIYASKGCPYSCIFCTERNTVLKKRSAKSILDELKYLTRNFGIRTVSFFDETFTIDASRVTALAESIAKEKLGIKWYCNSRVDLVSEGLLKKMYEGGCRGISFGIESGSQKVLDLAEKGTKIEQAELAIRSAKATGMKVHCSFILGLPGENWNTIRETIAFVKRTLPTGAQFNVAVPYPGTRLYEIALNKGWIRKGVSWQDMFQHEAVMSTKELSCEDLNEARKLAYRALYLNPRWWLQNILYAVKNPEDFQLATRYAIKIVENYLFHRMVHAH